MSKKRWIAGLLSAVMALSVAFVNPTTVKAAGWLDDVTEMETGVIYSDSFSDLDYSSPADYRTDGYYHVYKFEIPEDGGIHVGIESPEGGIGNYWLCLELYRVDDTDNNVYVIDGDNLLSYSQSRGVYYSKEDTLNYGLTKGGYYLVFSLWKYKTLGFPTQSYSITVDYTPSVPLSKFNSVKKTKNGLDLKWNRVNGIDGYQIEYSTKEDFSVKKKTVTIKDAKTVKQLIKGIKKKKTYYVRIRSYKYVKVNGEKEQFFSDWSETSTL